MRKTIGSARARDHKAGWIRAMAALAVVAGLSACGAPNAIDLCMENCNIGKRCLNSSDTQVANCQTDCNNKRGSLADADAALAKQCKNSGDMRKAELQCYSLECSKIIPCLLGIPAQCLKY